MAVPGSIIFSHVLPVILAFFGIIFLISGVMDNNKFKSVIGALLFILAAVSPFIFLRPFVL